MMRCSILLASLAVLAVGVAAGCQQSAPPVYAQTPYSPALQPHSQSAQPAPQSVQQMPAQSPGQSAFQQHPGTTGTAAPQPQGRTAPSTPSYPSQAPTTSSGSGSR